MQSLSMSRILFRHCISNLNKIWREAVGEEVQEGVNGRALGLLLLLDGGVGVGGPWLDDHSEDDAEADGQTGGGHVVQHRPAPDLAAQPEIQRPDGGDQAGHDQREDQALEHVEEDLARVAHIEGLSGGVDPITNRFQGKAQRDTLHGMPF